MVVVAYYRLKFSVLLGLARMHHWFFLSSKHTAQSWTALLNDSNSQLNMSCKCQENFHFFLHYYRRISHLFFIIFSFYSVAVVCSKVIFSEICFELCTTRGDIIKIITTLAFLFSKRHDFQLCFDERVKWNISRTCNLEYGKKSLNFFFRCSTISWYSIVCRCCWFILMKLETR